MPLTLKEISSNNSFVEKLRPINYYAGKYISEYVTLGKKLRVDPNVIQEIVEKFTKAGDNSDLHKIKLSNGKEILVNDAGLLELES